MHGCRTGARIKSARQRAGTQAIGTLTIILALITAAFATAHIASHNSSGAATVVRVYMDDFDFDLSRKRIPAGRVIFRLTNRGTIEHTFSIEGVTSPTVHVKSTVVMRVTLRTPGTYYYQCTIPGHFTWGMHGSLEIVPRTTRIVT